jgi:hypothetical protein
MMTSEHTELWKRIQHFELDDPQSEFTFSDRLARENDWTLEFALRAILEYKKFMFLQCMADHPLTPSDQVDQVWHLHLLYTQSYWLEFCEKILSRQVHHGPTKGGTQERTKYTDLYERTLKLYETYFHESPPKEIWPESQKRFSEIHFRRVNITANWIIPKPSLLKS